MWPDQQADLRPVQPADQHDLLGRDEGGLGRGGGGGLPSTVEGHAGTLARARPHLGACPLNSQLAANARSIHKSFVFV